VSRMGGPRWFAAALGVILIAACLGGCSQMSNPSYDVAEIGCEGASDATVRTIQARLTVDGTLRNGKQLASRDTLRTFVSAELHLRGDEAHADGDILTWVTDDVGGREFASVDVNARDDSSWPHAEGDVRASGARESRACVSPSRGKTRAQVQCELDQASGEIPADRKCDER
jgi:hypothetical protein